MLLAIYVPMFLLGKDLRLEFQSYSTRISLTLIDDIKQYFKVL